MIAMTNKNGKRVRLSADFQFDTGKAYFRVCCEGVIFEFDQFGPAAKVYKSLSKRLEDENFTDTYLKNLVAGARAMGYCVKEAA